MGRRDETPLERRVKRLRRREGGGRDFIECIPPHAQYSHLALFVERCIFINRRGRSFIREDAPRDEFRDAVLALPNREAFVVLDEAGFETHPTAFRRDAEKALSLGEVFRADSLEALARQLRVPAENLIETVAAFNESVKRRNDPEFGRSRESLRCLIERPPFWASKAFLSIHYTPGCVDIDSRARVLDRFGRPIPRLFAAGEVSSGVHGAARLGTVAILDCLVFGRVAGQAVAKN